MLVSSVSNFNPDTRGWRWSLVRFTCSVLLPGGRGAADKCHWRVWGVPAVFRPHWVCPRPRVCAFPVYTAQGPGCSIGSGPCVACGSSFRVLHKSTDSVGPAFCAFPCWSSPGSQELDGRTLPGAGRLIPSAVPASVSLRQSGAPCVCSGELVSSCHPPGGCQPSRISGSLWLETGSLFAVW